MKFDNNDQLGYCEILKSIYYNLLNSLKLNSKISSNEKNGYCARKQFKKKKRNISEENILVQYPLYFIFLTWDSPLSPRDFCKSCSLIHAGINYTPKRTIDLFIIHYINIISRSIVVIDHEDNDDDNNI